jgi:opacity protein-like surface antigen
MNRVYVLLLMVFAASGATAQTLDTELTAFGGYRLGGTFDVADTGASYEVDDSASFGLIWNHAARGNTQYEVFYSYQDSEAQLNASMLFDPVVDLETHILEIGGTYLWDGGMLQPYLAATVGGTHIKTRARDPESDTFLSGSIGLGFKVAPTSRLGMRLEARAHGVLMQDDTKLFCATGPDINVCGVDIEGNLFSQVELFAGIVLRF